LQSSSWKEREDSVTRVNFFLTSGVFVLFLCWLRFASWCH